MFKIVSTCRNGRVELSTVPASWESDGKLRWPKSKPDLLSKDPEVLPQEEWLTLDCVLKRKNFSSYEAAEEELRRMLEQTDSEDADCDETQTDQIKKNYRRKQFYIVQFIQLPYPDIEDYVCVPKSWIKHESVFDQFVYVVYPKEDPDLTKERVKRKMRCNNLCFPRYKATVIHKTDTFVNAQKWIAKKTGRPVSVDKKPKASGFQKLPKLEKPRLLEIPSGRIKRKPLPRISIRMPYVEDYYKRMKYRNQNQLKVNPNAVLKSASMPLVHSKQIPTILDKDNHLIQSAKSKGSGASNSQTSTEQNTPPEFKKKDKPIDIPIQPASSKRTNVNQLLSFGQKSKQPLGNNIDPVKEFQPEPIMEKISSPPKVTSENQLSSMGQSGEQLLSMFVKENIEADKELQSNPDAVLNPASMARAHAKQKPTILDNQLIQSAKTKRSGASDSQMSTEQNTQPEFNKKDKLTDIPIKPASSKRTNVNHLLYFGQKSKQPLGDTINPDKEFQPEPILENTTSPKTTSENQSSSVGKNRDQLLSMSIKENIEADKKLQPKVITENRSSLSKTLTSASELASLPEPVNEGAISPSVPHGHSLSEQYPHERPSNQSEEPNDSQTQPNQILTTTMRILKPSSTFGEPIKQFEHTQIPCLSVTNACYESLDIVGENSTEVIHIHQRPNITFQDNKSKTPSSKRQSPLINMHIDYVNKKTRTENTMKSTPPIRWRVNLTTQPSSSSMSVITQAPRPTQNQLQPNMQEYNEIASVQGNCTDQNVPIQVLERTPAAQNFSNLAHQSQGSIEPSYKRQNTPPQEEYLQRIAYIQDMFRRPSIPCIDQRAYLPNELPKQSHQSNQSSQVLAQQENPAFTNEAVRNEMLKRSIDGTYAYHKPNAQNIIENMPLVVQNVCNVSNQLYLQPRQVPSEATTQMGFPFDLMIGPQRSEPQRNPSFATPHTSNESLSNGQEISNVSNQLCLQPRHIPSAQMGFHFDLMVSSQKSEPQKTSNQSFSSGHKNCSPKVQRVQVLQIQNPMEKRNVDLATGKEAITIEPAIEASANMANSEDQSRISSEQLYQTNFQATHTENIVKSAPPIQQPLDLTMQPSSSSVFMQAPLAQNQLQPILQVNNAIGNIEGNCSNQNVPIQLLRSTPTTQNFSNLTHQSQDFVEPSHNRQYSATQEEYLQRIACIQDMFRMPSIPSIDQKAYLPNELPKQSHQSNQSSQFLAQQENPAFTNEAVRNEMLKRSIDGTYAYHKPNAQNIIENMPLVVQNVCNVSNQLYLQPRQVPSAPTTQMGFPFDLMIGPQTSEPQRTLSLATPHTSNRSFSNGQKICSPKIPRFQVIQNQKPMDNSKVNLATVPETSTTMTNSESQNTTSPEQLHETNSTLVVENRNLYSKNIIVDQATQTDSIMDVNDYEDETVCSPVLECALRVMDSACQTEDCLVEKQRLLYQEGAEALKDFEAITNHETSPNETDSFNDDKASEDNHFNECVFPEISTEERPSTSQKNIPENHQENSTTVTFQDILDDTGVLFAQMGNNFAIVKDMYNKLRNSTYECAQLYKVLLEKVDKYNSKNQTSHQIPTSSKRN